MHKSILDHERYDQSGDVYDLANCFLSLNALPDWILRDETAPQALRDLAFEKRRIMSREVDSPLDVEKMDDIDEKLKLVRLFCNHAKHADPKKLLPVINMSVKLPATFPIRFEDITVGGREFNASKLVAAVIEFWKPFIPLEEYD
jgi:hypothetical protein